MEELLKLSQINFPIKLVDDDVMSLCSQASLCGSMLIYVVEELLVRALSLTRRRKNHWAGTNYIFKQQWRAQHQHHNETTSIVKSHCSLGGTREVSLLFITCFINNCHNPSPSPKLKGLGVTLFCCATHHHHHPPTKTCFSNQTSNWAQIITLDLNQNHLI